LPAGGLQRWGLMVAALAALALGCATGHQGWVQAMVGRPYAQLARELGPPDAVRELGGGARLYTWRITLADHTPVQMRRRPLRDGRPVFLTEYHGPAYYNQGRLRLWVDPGGRVSRAAWDHRRSVR